MKWLKRILLTIAVLLLLSIFGAVFMNRMAGQVPDWFAQPLSTPEARAAAAQRAENKLSEIHNFAAFAGGPTTGPVPAGAFEISFTQEELNAVFTKWSVMHNWKSKYEEYLSDPAIVLKKDRLIVAGRMKDLDKVASIHVAPRLDTKGQLHLELLQFQAGLLPLPGAALAKHRDKLVDSIQSKMPGWQTNARIDSSGKTNKSARDVGLARLFLDMLRHEPSEPTLFLPVERGHVPVKLTKVKIEEGVLRMTVEPLSASERAALLQRLREPHASATASR